MANPWRGEVALHINGQRREMKLTLGALARLEARLHVGSLVELVERFEASAFSSADVLALLHAGLEGGGTQISEEELARADITGGPMAASKAAAALLVAAFTVPGDSR